MSCSSFQKAWPTERAVKYILTVDKKSNVCMRLEKSCINEAKFTNVAKIKQTIRPFLQHRMEA